MLVRVCVIGATDSEELLSVTSSQAESKKEMLVVMEHVTMTRTSFENAIWVCFLRIIESCLWRQKSMSFLFFFSILAETACNAHDSDHAEVIATFIFVNSMLICLYV